MPECHAGSYRLHYQWGDGFSPERPTAVFLHDGLGAVGSWRGLPARLERALNLNSLAYDRFGYGRSQRRADFSETFMEDEVPELLALLDHLGVERAHLIGHSDGGSIALLAAAWHPHRVATVTTEAAHTFVEPETRAGILALMALQATGNTPAWLGKLHGERAGHLLRTWCERWLSDSHARWNIRHHLTGVRCPLLAIQGDRDGFGTRAQLDSILEKVPGAQSWIVPGGGHTPHAEDEEAFLGRLCGFLREHLPG